MTPAARPVSTLSGNTNFSSTTSSNTPSRDTHSNIMHSSDRRYGPPLLATLRLQFSRRFTLFDAIPLIEGFAAMGISHIYASPLLTASPGSAHGYDVTDPTRINNEIGGELALQQFVAELRRCGMGLIVDVVPNHMAVGCHNPWWQDVLMWGPKSRHAEYFDIRWGSDIRSGSKRRLLLPFLRSDYGQALHDRELTLHYRPSSGTFFVAHHEHRFPLCPASYDAILRHSDDPELQRLSDEFRQARDSADTDHYQQLIDQLRTLGLAHTHHLDIQHCVEKFDLNSTAGRERLHALLEAQHYRLASWRTADDEVNWRRFFNVNHLAGVRVESAPVFEDMHRLVLTMIRRGWIDGLRIDHVDGLANPRAYCRKLRRLAEDAAHDSRATRHYRAAPDSSVAPGSSAAPGSNVTSDVTYHIAQPEFPIHVEKILAADERIPASWQVAGDTGYAFMNQVSLLLHAPQGEATLQTLWAEVSDRPAKFAEEGREARAYMLTSAFNADLEALLDDATSLANCQLDTRDLTRASFRRALVELISHFPVYRTYAGGCGRSAEDERFFRLAFERATDSLLPTDWPALERLDAWLGGEPFHHQPPGSLRQLRQRILTRFQQLTSPVAAKGVEDTALYRAGVLLSRYDVGFNSEQFSAAPELFHAACVERAEKYPATLLATSTHDTKRGEDMRTRLATLSECSQWYAEKARHWLLLAEPLCHGLPQGLAPHAADRLVLFQTLLGSWPFATAADPLTASASLTDSEPLTASGPLTAPDALPASWLQRLQQWQYKALREAKLHTHWLAHNEPYEHACNDFLRQLLTDPGARVLREELYQAACSLAAAGALNSLTQTVLKMTTPGVPDFYQGTDLWDLSLVDPDNRRPVDFERHIDIAARHSDGAALLTDWPSGRIKQHIIYRTLAVRRASPSLWLSGDYRPLPVHGTHADSVLAFIRSNGNQYALVVVPVRCARLLAPAGEAAALPMVAAEMWRDTAVEVPDELKGRILEEVCCGNEHVVTRSDVPVTQLLSRFPVAVYMTRSTE